MNFKLINNKLEYDNLALSLINDFDSVDDWLEFFDIWSYNDEKYDEICDWNKFLHNEYKQGKLQIAYAPSNNEFPIVLVSLFEKSWDRYANTTTEMWNWESLNRLMLESKDVN